MSQRDPLFNRDLIKLLFLVVAILGVCGIFLITPGLQSSSLITLIMSTFLSPWVARLERRGISKGWSIGIIFFSLLLLVVVIGNRIFHLGVSEWDSLKETVPVYFHSATGKVKLLETQLKASYPLFRNIQPTETLLRFGNDTARWFVDHGASMLGEVLTWLLLVPPLTFFLLQEGQNMRQEFLKLVPNRYFESFYLVSTDITNAISDYLRAKLLEALLVGLVVMAGLWLIHAPYPAVLGVIAGVTNIIPYLGPLVGAAPGLLIVAFSEHSTAGLLGMTLVYLIANVLDSVYFFPVVVAKLVRLHPLILTAVVIAGQQYYGLIGMLISIPIASAIKVILQETYLMVYEQRPAPPDSDEPSHLTPSV